jgi:hypothetical protein
MEFIEGSIEEDVDIFQIPDFDLNSKFDLLSILRKSERSEYSPLRPAPLVMDLLKAMRKIDGENTFPYKKWFHFFVLLFIFFFF